MKKLLLSLTMVLCTVCASAITIDDLCGTYIRHIDNISTNGMGAAIIADATLEITKKDDNTLVFSKMYSSDGFPVEGVVDMSAKTITFAAGQQVGIMGEFPQVLANSWGGTKDDEPIVGKFNDEGTFTIGSEDEAYAGFCVSLPNGMTVFQAQGIITLEKKGITADDLCGSYTRHINNISTGGMGAAMIADATLEVTKKDDNTLIFSKLFVDEGFPVEGVLDGKKRTITFAAGQQVGEMNGIPQVLANSWGGTKDDEPIVATIDEKGNIVLGSEDNAYAGFCVSLPNGMTIFQAQGIITLEKNLKVLWESPAEYIFSDGKYAQGSSKVVCYNPQFVDYDYSFELKNYWGKYDVKIKVNEDGTLSLYEVNEETNEAALVQESYLYWVIYYGNEYKYWQDYLHLSAADATIVGNENGGTITFNGDYCLFTAETEEAFDDENLQPTIYEPGKLVLTWGDGGASSIAAPVVAKPVDNAIYNLAGQRVNTLTKGIYIKNGKKFMVK